MIFAVLIAALLPLAAFPGEAEDVRLFEPSAAWERPEDLTLAEGDLLFNDPYTTQFGSRTFTFMGRLDNGLSWVVSVFRWRYSFWHGWGLSVLAADPAGDSFVYEEKIPDEAMSVAEDRLSIRFEEGSIEGADGLYRIRLNLEGFSCDLSIRNLLPPWQPGDGYAWLNPDRDAYMRFGVSSPWAETRGTLTLQGRPMSGQGECYADRSRYSIPIRRLNTALTAFRVFSPAGTPASDRWMISALHYRTHEEYGARDLPVVYLAHAGRWVFTTRGSTPIPDGFRKEAGYSIPYPGRFEVEAAGRGSSLNGVFIVEKVVQYTDIFDKLPGFLRPVASVFFDRPVVFRFTGRFEGTFASPDGTTRGLSLPGLGEYYVVR